MQMIGGNKFEVEEGEYMGLLTYQNYLNIEALGESSIDK